MALRTSLKMFSALTKALGKGAKGQGLKLLSTHRAPYVGFPAARGTRSQPDAPGLKQELPAVVAGGDPQPTVRATHLRPIRPSQAFCKQVHRTHFR